MHLVLQPVFTEAVIFQLLGIYCQQLAAYYIYQTIESNLGPPQIIVFIM